MTDLAIDPNEGVIVIDKPAGMTSHDVVGKIRRLVGSRPGRKGKRQGPKVGHAGTLDPAATGVLVVCIGRATRLVPWLQAATKTYEATVRLGRTTDTLDDDGVETSTTDASHVTTDDVQGVLGQFIGDIEQIPPMVSAIRVDGERLHEKARRGEVVERNPRPVTIQSITIDGMGYEPYPHVALTVVCSAGTYIRTLADDIGQALGVGGHLTALRRTASGQSTLAEAVPLEELDEAGLRAALQPPLTALSFLPTVTITSAMAEQLRNGQRPVALGLSTDTVAVDPDGYLVGIVHDVGNQLVSKLIMH
ncbi:tRNA pseudouridine(55) synthase TruB [Stomatohabitans albus]|uniref:tRNA pseudouridine(55) synthase TruB n=1 Tax=Stomatohabitans albus TaxID=3110766 RepID=UPI00300C951B